MNIYTDKQIYTGKPPLSCIISSSVISNISGGGGTVTYNGYTNPYWNDKNIYKIFNCQIHQINYKCLSIPL